MKLLWTWGSLAIFATQACGQALLPTTAAGSRLSVVESPPVPFASNTPTDADLDLAIELSDRGQSALGNGIVSEAVSCFKKALAIPNLDSATKDSLNLDLVTAYLAEREFDQAAETLQMVAATDTPAYLLRAALLEAESRTEQWDGPDGVAALLARIAPGNVSATDLPWYFTAEARLAEHQGNADAAKAAWNQAIDHAPLLLKNEFEAALWDSQVLLSKAPTADEVEKFRTEMAAAPTPALGAHFASLYAIGADQLGRHDEALGVVTDWIKHMDLDHKNRDMLRLLLVYLDNKGPAPADLTLDPQAVASRDRQALEDILQEPIDINSPDRESIWQMQGQALSLLEQQVFGKKPEGGSIVADPADLEKFIDGIIADQDADSHPLLEELYLFKARLALLLNQTDAAKTAASQLLEKYPPGTTADPYITDAQMVLAEVYWHNGQSDGQPRLAVNYLLKVYDSLPLAEQAPIERSLAYLYFMNGDYLNAAQFYTKLFNNPGSNSPIRRGDLLLRAVESELRAGSIDEAVKLLDDSESLVDADDRWWAEWNLLNAMVAQNRSEDAFQRLSHKLDPDHGKELLPPDLYLQLLWLNAYLAVGRNQAEAGKTVENLTTEVKSFTPEVLARLPPDERDKLSNLLPKLLAEALLLQGETEGQAQQYDDQHKTFELLRQNYPGSDTASDSASVPALNSYFVEAGELDRQDKFTEAQRLYNTVTDNFPKSTLAPLALYLSARDSEKLDKTGKYTEALNLLNTFMLKYADSEAGAPQIYAADQSLIYRVQLEQADLERNINEDPKDKSLENAADLYALLIKKYPNDPQTVLAKVGRAECLFELATLPDADPQRREDAIDELHVLYNQADLPVDARVEVGYKLGKLQEHDSKTDPGAAADTYYGIVKEIMGDPSLATALDNSPRGRFWMLNCLTSLKKIYENQNMDTDAANVGRMIVEYGLDTPVLPVAPAPIQATAN